MRSNLNYSTKDSLRLVKLLNQLPEEVTVKKTSFLLNGNVFTAWQISWNHTYPHVIAMDLIEACKIFLERNNFIVHEKIIDSPD